VVDAAGQITDVRISYPRDLTTQMLDYSRNGHVPRPHAAAGC
jgi:hypothetical protein